MRVKEEKTHCKFSASSSERWLNGCPGSIRLSEGVPKMPETDYAQEGTGSHSCLEKFLLNPQFPKRITRELLKEFDNEQVGHALDAAKLFTSRAEGVALIPERKVLLTYIDDDLGGTTDVSIIEEFGRLEIDDYKYGAGIVVEPDRNPQLLIYLAGVAHEHDYNFTEFNVGIYQPRAPHEKGPFRTWKVSYDYLRRFEEKLAKGVELCRKPDAPVRAGEWCRWCPAAQTDPKTGASFCPAISKRALQKAGADFSPVTGALKLPSRIVDTKRMCQTLAAMDQLEAWIKATRAQAFKMLLDGHKLPGFKLVNRRSSRKWTDPVKTEKQARKLFGDAALDISLKSPAQLEKIAGKNWVKKLVTNETGGLTMASDTDKRNQIKCVNNDFGAV